MLKSLLRDRYLLILVFLFVLVQLFSLNSHWVEVYYSLSFYPLISGLLRFLFGWLPFSFGDLFYIFSFGWLVFKILKMLKAMRRQGFKTYINWGRFRFLLKLVLLVYLVFSVFWGLNYYRQGIQKEVGIQLKPYTEEDLFSLTQILHQKLNSNAAQIDSTQRQKLQTNSFLFTKAAEAYQQTAQRFPYLSYQRTSIKPSIFTPVGHWFGFTGYYNPFSGEAQLKTSIPVFLKPFVVTHEIAHQLGYAKENEASFVAYLTCKTTDDVDFRYAVYFELFREAIFQCRRSFYKQSADSLSRQLHQRVQMDMLELKDYHLANKNWIEPIMTGFYDRYLRLNNQPNGKATYNEVIAYLVAYIKKYGVNAL